MNWRYRFTLFLLTLAFLFVIARLFYWQVVKADELTLMGQAQYGNIIKLSPKRGEIKTSDGFSIVSNKITYLAYANPKEVKQKDVQAKLLAPILTLEEATISALLSYDRFWVPLKRRVDADTKASIDKLGISGIGFEEESIRLYPEASLGAQLVGFVGKDEAGDDRGYFGIEGFYDRQLKGRGKAVLQIKDALGRPILAKMTTPVKEIKGRSLVLTIDRAMQYIVEKSLKENIEKFGAVGGMVGIIDPKTGNILAMSSFPSFDPRTYQDYDSSLYKNPFISNVFEPGSTFKTLIMASALDKGVVKPDTTCDICEGPVAIGGYQIHTWNNQYQQGMTMTDVIMHSDNTGMVFVSQKLGLDNMLDYFKKFGIGDLTNIDLQGEVAPGIKLKDQWYPIDVATASFGQGISVTPIELLSAVSSIANNGQRMWPHIVSKIETPDGETLSVEPKAINNPISSKTAKVMTEIMVNAVDNGEAQFAKPKGYRIAGKTGTAQIPIEGHYDPTKTIASFVGFAPADNPKFAMLVIIDRPTSSIYGAETAAPVFFDIAKKLFDYYGIIPTN